MKAELRADIFKKRADMSVAEVRRKSAAIKKRLFSLKEFRTAQKILFYVSYGNEVSTHSMIQESLRKGKQVVIPKTDVKQKALLLCEVFQWDDLAPGVYSILEPKPECIKICPFSEVDLIMVPGVAFDLQGNRIGHGKGYYDRLLNASHPALRVGLAFELQIVDHISREHHDRNVDRIITEKRMITCS